MRDANLRLLSSSNDSAEISRQEVFDYEAASSIGLSCAAAIVQVVYQRHGGSANLFSISSIIVSLFFCLASKYLSSRGCVSAARRCSGVALFSAALAIASLLAMPLGGKFKCIPYSLCFFPLVALLPDLFPCLKCLENPWVFFLRARSQEEEEDEEKGLASANPAVVLNSNRPISNASLQMAVRPPIVMDVADANAKISDADEEASDEYCCFAS